MAIQMIINSGPRRFLSIAMLAALSACATVPPEPRDLLDERTGVTVSVPGAPIEFTNEASGASANDFLTLVAVQRDDQGQYTTLLLLYRWQARYDGDQVPAEAGAGDLQIVADGRTLDLQPLPRPPAGLPRAKDLFVPAVTQPAMRAYATDLETIRLIATSHNMTVKLPVESPNGSYTMWHDGRPALEQFVKHLSGL
jgi:hypothetical protein